MARGPEYADHLTDAEQRTLDALVVEVERRGRMPRRGSWRAPVAAGLAALVILSAATIISQLDLTAAPPPPAAIGDTGPAAAPPAETLAELAAAAAAVPDPPVPAKHWYRRQLHVAIDGEREPCQLTAVSAELREPVHQPRDEPFIVRMTAELVTDSGGPATTRAYRPDPATGWPGCAEVAVTREVTPRFEGEGELEEVWYELIEWLEAPPPDDYDLGFPGDILVLPKQVDAPAPARGWWAELVGLLTSPQAESASRAAALREAASRGEAVAVPEVTADQTGRPGTTVRVPYGDRAAAELTFDRETGALLQRVVYTGTGLKITAYLDTRER